MALKAKDLTMTITIRVSTWRVRWGLRALRLAMSIAPDRPVIVNALKRAAVNVINWGVRFKVGDRKWFRVPRVVSESIFD